MSHVDIAGSVPALARAESTFIILATPSGPAKRVKNFPTIINIGAIDALEIAPRDGVGVITLGDDGRGHELFQRHQFGIQ